MSEKQALVDFATMTRALLEVSFSSTWGRCSIQYHPAPRAATTTTAIAGLRYAESIIAGSIQTYCRVSMAGNAANRITDLRLSLRAQRSNDKKSVPQGARRFVAASLYSVPRPFIATLLRRGGLVRH